MKLNHVETKTGTVLSQRVGMASLCLRVSPECLQEELLLLLRRLVIASLSVEQRLQFENEAQRLLADIRVRTGTVIHGWTKVAEPAMGQVADAAAVKDVDAAQQSSSKLELRGAH